MGRRPAFISGRSVHPGIQEAHQRARRFEDRLVPGAQVLEGESDQGPFRARRMGVQEEVTELDFRDRGLGRWRLCGYGLAIDWHGWHIRRSAPLDRQIGRQTPVGEELPSPC